MQFIRQRMDFQSLSHGNRMYLHCTENKCTLLLSYSSSFPVVSTWQQVLTLLKCCWAGYWKLPSVFAVHSFISICDPRILQSRVSSLSFQKCSCIWLVWLCLTLHNLLLALCIIAFSAEIMLMVFIGKEDEWTVTVIVLWLKCTLHEEWCLKKKKEKKGSLCWKMFPKCFASVGQLSVSFGYGFALRCLIFFKCQVVQMSKFGSSYPSAKRFGVSCCWEPLKSLNMPKKLQDFVEIYQPGDL